jgi:ketosteroid isomerase-like protein
MSPAAEIVTRIFAETAVDGGSPTFVEHMADDMVFRTIGSGPWSGEFKGKEAILDGIFRPLRRRLEHRKTIAHNIIDAGDTVVVQARGDAVTREGRRYDNDYCFIIRFRDGKMAVYEEYCDTALIDRVLGDRPLKSA